MASLGNGSPLSKESIPEGRCRSSASYGRTVFRRKPELQSEMISSEAVKIKYSLSIQRKEEVGVITLLQDFRKDRRKTIQLTNATSVKC